MHAGSLMTWLYWGPVLVWLLWSVPHCNAFVPGLTPKVYGFGQNIELKVNSLTSVKSQIPFSFYALPFCKPPRIRVVSPDSIGEILVGDTWLNTAFNISFPNETTCELLCEVELTERQLRMVNRLIDDDYIVTWSLDNLLAISSGYELAPDGPDAIVRSRMVGFPVGFKHLEGDKVKRYIHNYFHMIVKYRFVEAISPKNAETSAKTLSNLGEPPSNWSAQIVGFEVLPVSYSPKTRDPKHMCDPLKSSLAGSDSSYSLSTENLKSIPYIFDVKFEESNVPYAHRWDAYFEAQERMAPSGRLDVHWLSILNSLIVVLFLSGVVAAILIKLLKTDITKYNELITATDEVEESGWKLLHGDVFRKPPHSTFLAAFVGSGVQILGMVVVTMLVGAVFIERAPEDGGISRAKLLQIGMVLWAFMGVAAGYTAARFYKTFESGNWKMTTLRTALTYPGVVFSLFFIINSILVFEQSSAAAPFGTIFTIALLWFGISVPLIYMGAYLGFRQPAISMPARVNKIPRQIPDQPRAFSAVFMCLLGGSLPFVAASTELIFIFSSLWNHRTYQLFGVLLVVLLILMITCAEIAITMTYVQLACESYTWWWRSFFVPGASALYVFGFSVLYFFTRLNIHRIASVVLYFGYSLIISYTFFLLTGSIGFIGAFLFVRKIYGSIKVD